MRQMSFVINTRTHSAVKLFSQDEYKNTPCISNYKTFWLFKIHKFCHKKLPNNLLRFCAVTLAKTSGRASRSTRVVLLLIPILRWVVRNRIEHWKELDDVVGAITMVRNERVYCFDAALQFYGFVPRPSAP